MPEYVRLRHQSSATATLWMTIGVLLLGWIPFFNGVIAGVVGGFRSKHLKYAIEAVLATTLISTVTLFVLFDVFQVSPKYLYSGMTLLGWMAVTFTGLAIGALSGVYLREPRFISEKWMGPKFEYEGGHHRNHYGPPITPAPTSPLDEDL